MRTVFDKCSLHPLAVGLWLFKFPFLNSFSVVRRFPAIVPAINPSRHISINEFVLCTVTSDRRTGCFFLRKFVSRHSQKRLCVVTLSIAFLLGRRFDPVLLGHVSLQTLALDAEDLLIDIGLQSLYWP